MGASPGTGDYGSESWPRHRQHAPDGVVFRRLGARSLPWASAHGKHPYSYGPLGRRPSPRSCVYTGRCLIGAQIRARCATSDDRKQRCGKERPAQCEGPDVHPAITITISRPRNTCAKTDDQRKQKRQSGLTHKRQSAEPSQTMRKDNHESNRKQDPHDSQGCESHGTKREWRSWTKVLDAAVVAQRFSDRPSAFRALAFKRKPLERIPTARTRCFILNRVNVGACRNIAGHG